MTTLPVLDLTSQFVREFEQLESQVARLSVENKEFRSRPVSQSVPMALDIEQRLASALAEVASLKKQLATEQTAAAKANSQVGETSRLVANLRSELNTMALKGCPHCDQLREQLKTRQTELQLSNSQQQALQVRIRELETAPITTAVAATDPRELSLLKQQSQVLRQERDEAASKLKECEKFKLKVEMDRLRQLNP